MIKQFLVMVVFSHGPTGICDMTATGAIISK